MTYDPSLPLNAQNVGYEHEEPDNGDVRLTKDGVELTIRAAEANPLLVDYYLADGWEEL